MTHNDDCDDRAECEAMVNMANELSDVFFKYVSEKYPEHTIEQKRRVFYALAHVFASYTLSNTRLPITTAVAVLADQWESLSNGAPNAVRYVGGMSFPEAVLKGQS